MVLFMISGAIVYFVEYRRLKPLAGQYAKERRFLRMVLWIYWIAGAVGLAGLKILYWAVY